MFRTVNYRRLSEFCLGALGWSPEQLWHEARLQDIADALEGYAVYQLGITDKAQNLPSAGFMSDMINLFPDV